MTLQIRVRDFWKASICRKLSRSSLLNREKVSDLSMLKSSLICLTVSLESEEGDSKNRFGESLRKFGYDSSGATCKSFWFRTTSTCQSTWCAI